MIDQTIAGDVGNPRPPTGRVVLEPAWPTTETPRDLHSRTLDDRASLLGSFVGAFGLVWIVVTQIMPIHSVLGFIICWYFAFLAVYGIVSAAGNSAVVVRDRLASAAVHGAAMIVGAALVTAVAFTVYRGAPALPHINFYTRDMAGVGPSDPFHRGGILQALVGSLIEIGIATAVTLPLGVGTAVFMTEVPGRFARVVRTVVEAMTALPSIVAGLFIYTFLIVTFHVPRTGFAASMAIAVMMLPIIARAADVVLRVVPGGLREAGLALGSTQWRVVWHVIVPTARPGLATALILGIARGVGETSPVLLTSGNSTFMNFDPIHNPMTSLPLFIYFAVRSGEPTYIIRGYGAAVVLLAMVFLLFVTARRLARQRGGQR